MTAASDFPLSGWTCLSCRLAVRAEPTDALASRSIYFLAALAGCDHADGARLMQYMDEHPVDGPGACGHLVQVYAHPNRDSALCADCLRSWWSQSMREMRADPDRLPKLIDEYASRGIRVTVERRVAHLAPAIPLVPRDHGDVVAFCERLLDDARAGKIDTLMVVADYGQKILTRFAGAKSRVQKFGMLGIAQAELAEDWTESATSPVTDPEE